mmetsp:Transcript_87898/g.226589  ORF Transcript_87898/g.226589 Transcript_87898/m.226589 type:complete len:657 (+) Transcript_87898:869-2839(+)
MKQVPELASGEARLLEAALRIEHSLLCWEVLRSLAERVTSGTNAPDAHKHHELLGIEVVREAAVLGAHVVPRSVDQEECSRVVGQDVVDVDGIIQAVPEVEGLAANILEGRLRRLQRVDHLLNAVPGAQHAPALDVVDHLLGHGVQPVQGNVHDGLRMSAHAGGAGVATQHQEMQPEPADLLQELLGAPGGGVRLLGLNACVFLRQLLLRGLGYLRELEGLTHRPCRSRLLCLELLLDAQLVREATGEHLVHAHGELVVMGQEAPKLIMVPRHTHHPILREEGEGFAGGVVAQELGRADHRAGAYHSALLGGVVGGLSAAAHHERQDSVIRLVQNVARLIDGPAAALAGKELAELDLREALLAQYDRVQQGLVHSHLLQGHLIELPREVHDTQRQKREEGRCSMPVRFRQGIHAVEAVRGILRSHTHAGSRDRQLQRRGPMLSHLAHMLLHPAELLLPGVGHLRSLAHPRDQGIHTLHGVPLLCLLQRGLECRRDLLPDGHVILLQRGVARGCNETVENLHILIRHLHAELGRSGPKLLLRNHAIVVQVEVLERGSDNRPHLICREIVLRQPGQHDAKAPEAVHERITVDAILFIDVLRLVPLQELHEAVSVTLRQAKGVLVGQLDSRLSDLMWTKATRPLVERIEQTPQLAPRRR